MIKPSETSESLSELQDELFMTNLAVMEVALCCKVTHYIYNMQEIRGKVQEWMA